MWTYCSSYWIFLRVLLHQLSILTAATYYYYYYFRLIILIKLPWIFWKIFTWSGWAYKGTKSDVLFEPTFDTTLRQIHECVVTKEMNNNNNEKVNMSFKSIPLHYLKDSWRLKNSTALNIYKYHRFAPCSWLFWITKRTNGKKKYCYGLVKSKVRGFQRVPLTGDVTYFQEQ